MRYLELRDLIAKEAGVDTKQVDQIMPAIAAQLSEAWASGFRSGFRSANADNPVESSEL